MFPFRHLLCTALVVAGAMVCSGAPETGVGPVSASGTNMPGGLTLSLSTSGFKFTPVIGSLIHAGTGANDLAGRRLPADSVSNSPQVFKATATLLNQTGEPIDFVFPTQEDAKDHFVFRVYDATGNLIWESKTNSPTPQVITDITLRGHQAWRMTCFVPFVINGLPLAPGPYTLTATVNGSPQFETTTSFVVTQPIGINSGAPVGR